MLPTLPPVVTARKKEGQIQQFPQSLVFIRVFIWESGLLKGPISSSSTSSLTYVTVINVMACLETEVVQLTGHGSQITQISTENLNLKNS